MSNTDKYLTMSKYSGTDKQTSDTNNMMEEERRSKAYSKIIGSPTALSSVSVWCETTAGDSYHYRRLRTAELRSLISSVTPTASVPRLSRPSTRRLCTR